MTQDIQIVRGTVSRVRITDITIDGATPDLTGWNVFAQVRESPSSNATLLIDFAANFPTLIEIEDPATNPAVALTFTASMTRNLPTHRVAASVKIQDPGDPEIVYQLADLTLVVIDSITVVP